jgi:hypothetical protein
MSPDEPPMLNDYPVMLVSNVYNGCTTTEVQRPSSPNPKNSNPKNHAVMQPVQGLAWVLAVPPALARLPLVSRISDRPSDAGPISDFPVPMTVTDLV